MHISIAGAILGSSNAKCENMYRKTESRRRIVGIHVGTLMYYQFSSFESSYIDQNE